MRTLLVDNYDSFTYNLFHYLAEVNGREPAVVRNDDPAPTADDLREFDNIVISPGPGRPERPGDFGICRHLIEDGGLPLLGVCLGHQGLCHVFGGTVGHAPEVRHGRVSAVLHDQSELFAGIPSPFQVVRYHSLVVSELPSEVEATAWTRDGVLMGVRHRERPIWGVQFHPESISTEYGHQLLRNFRDLTEKWQLQNAGRGAGAARRAAQATSVTAAASAASTISSAPSAPTTLAASAAPRAQAASATTDPSSGAPHRVLVQSMPTPVVDEVVFDHLFRRSAHAFWLDSSRPDGELGRFSVMGDAAGPLARVAHADVVAGTVTVTSASGTQTVHTGFLDWLEADLAGHRVDLPDLPFEFALGWVGYLGYELKAECGGQLRNRSTEPDAVMVFADRAVVVDHLTSTTYLLALADAADEQPARDWLAATARQVAGLAERAPEAEAAAEPEPAGHTRPEAELRLRHDRKQYLDLIADCLTAIDQGESYEICLTNMAHADVSIDPWPAYRALRRASPAPFAAYLQMPSLAVLSSSPERFLRIGGDGVAESKPIKGTRPRGLTATEDELLRADLAGSEKDRSENLMIVDLVRNDLGRCAEVGSVHVPKLFDVESYATVHQLVSTVRAQLRPDSSAVAAVRAAFPGGSMTGAPKIRTMRIIDELEAGPRGVYSGAIGYFSLSGAADLNIVIRTAVITPSRISYGVGGAIVALSDPDEEFEETAVKAAPLLHLLDAAFPGRQREQAH